MTHSARDARVLSRRRPLAACCAALFALAAPAAALAANITNCNDVGPGSLRAAVAAAASGSTIDLSTLACSTITLEDFQIVIAQHDLTIAGPRQGITIAHDGAYDRIFYHQGTGTLKLTGLTITGGASYSLSERAIGGCVLSAGSVYLASSKVSYCSADAHGYAAIGGGIATQGVLIMVNSTLIGNFAGSALSTVGYGGGASAYGGFIAVNSSVQNNSARGTLRSEGGGVYASKTVTLNESTISGNSAEFAGGICACVFFNPAESSFIQNSTISGNHASVTVGGAFIAGTLNLRNSTVAFNSAGVGKSGASYQAPGLVVTGDAGHHDAILNSSILSNNTYLSNGATIENDFSTIGYSNGGTINVSGSDNLIRASVETFAPKVVTVTSCPLLGPLRNNGGATKTHALLSHSPAIDRGENSPPLPYDQRGMPFVRSGGNAPDIGAYEVQTADIVFNAGFDGCP